MNDDKDFIKGVVIMVFLFVVGVVLGLVLGMHQGQKNGRYYEQLTAVKEQRAFWKPNDMGEPEIFYIIPQKCSHCGQIPEKK